MKFKIQAARTNQIDEIISLWKRFQSEEPEAVPEADTAVCESAWSERLAKQIAESKVLVVASNEKIVGLLTFLDSRDREWIPAHIAYIVDTYIIPEARVSTAALDLFHEMVKQSQGVYAEIWTNTNVKNIRLQNLLKRVGFKRLDDFEIKDLKEQLYFRFCFQD
ncbi:MAG: GNAT family N-acetyltransferase [Planctomycetes bacterium]|nr:GNAT family N-acetyltransferase [Planctomycetota bacterium]